MSFADIIARLTERKPVAYTEIGRLKHDLHEVRVHNVDLARQLLHARRKADDATDALTVFRCELRKEHAEMLGEIVQLRAENRRLITDLVDVRRDRDGLRSQLDHALGYGADELGAIEAGKTKAEVTA
jgi:uncharacterized coiled-coil DUF342 family protein